MYRFITDALPVDFLNHDVEIWPATLAANGARDADMNTRRAAAGWHVLRDWEHKDTAEVAEEARQTVLALRSSPK